MKTRILITALLLLSSFCLSAKTVVVKGKVAVKIIEACKHGLDTIVAKDAVVSITALNTNSKESVNLAKVNRDGSFNISIDTKKYEFIIFSLLDTEISERHSVKELIKKKGINITLYQRKYKNSIENSEGGIPDSSIRVRIRKPAIYLYPEKETQISVKLEFKGKLGTTFPKYYEGWTVIAKPNGEITNVTDNRKYNYLFWEGTYNFSYDHYYYRNGFVVPKQVLDKFLIDKLSQLGLNNTEINDFVVYWLPELEKNDYNLIHFFINDNIDNTALLTVTPYPDTKIRVYMEFKAVDETYKIPEQDIPHIQRKGFTLVEWGGGMYDNNKVE